MSDDISSFPASSYVKIRLLQGAIYRDDAELWDALRAGHGEIRHYFWQIGQELVFDEGEGFAFLRQIERDGEKVPRLARRSALGYTTTLLLLCLREELVRFDTTEADSTRLVKTTAELHGLVGAFLRETNNQVRDAKAVDNAISQLCSLGFLRPINASDRESYEVMRIIKARITPAEIESIKERLSRYVQSGAKS